MKKSLLLSLLAVAVCSLAVYAEDVKLGDKIKSETQNTTTTIEKKADNASAIAQVTRNEKATKKVSKVSTKAKAKTKKAAAKVNNAVDKVATVKSDFATSTTTVTTEIISTVSSTAVTDAVVLSTCPTVTK